MAVFNHELVLVWLKKADNFAPVGKKRSFSTSGALAHAVRHVTCVMMPCYY